MPKHGMQAPVSTRLVLVSSRRGLSMLSKGPPVLLLLVLLLMLMVHCFAALLEHRFVFRATLLPGGPDYRYETEGGTSLPG